MKTIFSGVQPSGNLHIGNYIGALRQWVKMQGNTDAIFCVVDLHAITVPQHPQVLREKVLEVAALYLACGIDPQKAHIFIQSENPDHTYLAWILDTITSMGQLFRMTQYKDKIKQFQPNITNIKDVGLTLNVENSKITKVSGMMDDYFEEMRARMFDGPVGLFNYPVLMASDILLYQTDEVPVGEDQQQHIELTRDLAEKFNKKYGKVFKLPVALIQKEKAARIMSLQNPILKMSKSDKDPLGTINLLDSEEQIRDKIKRAITDSGSEVSFGKDKPAISNLLTIYCVFSGESPLEAEMSFRGRSYSQFKDSLADLLVFNLTKIRKNYNEIRSNNLILRQILDEGRDYVKAKSAETLRIVKEKIGLFRGL